jgi:hypothetical protein
MIPILPGSTLEKKFERVIKISIEKEQTIPPPPPVPPPQLEVFDASKINYDFNYKFKSTLVGRFSSNKAKGFFNVGQDTINLIMETKSTLHKHKKHLTTTTQRTCIFKHLLYLKNKLRSIL